MSGVKDAAALKVNIEFDVGKSNIPLSMLLYSCTCSCTAALIEVLDTAVAAAWKTPVAAGHF